MNTKKQLKFENYEEVKTEVNSFIEKVLKDDEDLKTRIQDINDCCSNALYEIEEYEYRKSDLVDTLITQIEEQTDIRDTESGSLRYLIRSSLHEDHGLESHPYY